ncbi:MAG: AAC(3) family N-acetyltransferase [Clostridiaceae bacterium]|nr:AAC(3) family N-acetyltransferase [Clostridiaceae bacterium]
MEIRDRIIKELHALGIRDGDTVLMHSSMKALGTGEAPEYVLNAIQDALGARGTLLLPALSYATVKFDQPNWSYYDTPVCVGLLPEMFRHLPGVIRSIHPTHSVCARGERAEELTAGHENDHTPVGENSPYRRLPGVGGKILMLGCGMGPMTFMHGVEEVAHAPYALLPEPWVYHMEDAAHRRFDMSVHRHGINRYGDQAYARMEALLETDEIARGKVLAADAYLLDSNAVLRHGVEMIGKNPYYFLKLHIDAPIAGASV